MANSKWITDGYTIETSEPVDFWVTRYILAQYGGNGKFEGVVDIRSSRDYPPHPVTYTIRKAVDCVVDAIDETHIPDDPNRRKNNAYNGELIERKS